MARNIYALTLLLTLGACAGSGTGTGGTTGGTGGGTTGGDIDPNKAQGPNADFTVGYQHYLGRVVPNSDGGVLASWPGSGVAVRVTGATSVTAYIAPREHGSYNSVGVLLDGKFLQTINLKNLYGPNPFKVAVPSTGDHTVSFLKRTESGNGAILFSKFTTDGQFEALTSPGRTVEVIGENATAGYSVEGPAGTFTGVPCQSTSYDAFDYVANPNFENAADTYGAQAANMFGADWSIVAYTGRGVVQNYDGSKGDSMPALWPRLDPQDYNTVSVPTQTPDVVVLNLGANDINFWLYNPNVAAPDMAGFVTGYAAFLQQIHTAYPKAAIIATVGPTLTDSQTLSTGQGLLTFATTAVQGAIAQVKSAGVNATFLAFTSAGSSSLSCDYFPDLAGHTQMASQLATAITTATGWKSGSTGTAQPAAAPKGNGPQNITGTFTALSDPLANAGDPNTTGVSTQEFPQCNVCSPSKSAQNVAGCSATIGTPEACQGYCHIPDGSVPPYLNNPPTSGNHYAMPAYLTGEYQALQGPIARGHLLHAMEHGAVIIAYNCPGGCAADLATIRSYVASTQQGSQDGNALSSGNAWVILTQDPLLTDTKFAAMSWTWSYTFDTVDTAALTCFVNQHIYYGRECTATTTTQRTDYLSAGCSPLLDKNMSSVTP